jgi:enoyl-CoA hydratase/carnithine racemase
LREAPSYQTILVDCDSQVATITLNRPDRLNAITPRMGSELGHALVTLDQRADIRAIVVTGAGRAFCVGAEVDLAAHDARADESEFGPAMKDLSAWRLNTPILAAINGPASGGGITFPLQWDIRLAAEDAKISFPFTRRALSPEANSTWLLSRAIGSSRALELLLTGRVITGTEAAAIGLVSRALPRDQVLPQTLELAREIATYTSPAAVSYTKQLFYESLETGDRDTARAEERAAYQWLLADEDIREGFNSFLEKRPPHWHTSKHAVPERAGRPAWIEAPEEPA